MTEQEAKLRAQAVYGKEQLFILLSITRANMDAGKSVPYVGMLESGDLMLFLFTSYENARKYVDKCGYETPGGVYPIGAVEKQHPFNNLYTIFNIASLMGIKKVDIDPMTKQAFGCDIDWFMEVNALEKETLSVVLSNEELGKVKEKDGEVPVRMNPVDIYAYENPYVISPQRADVILHHVFATDAQKDFTENFEELERIFVQEQALHENCFVADYINTRLIPSAQEKQKENDVRWFVLVNRLLQRVAWEKLAGEKLYILTEGQKGAVFQKNKFLYVLYTDLFKYMGRKSYREVKDREELRRIAKENGVENLVVTDGPHGTLIIEKPIWDKENG